MEPRLFLSFHTSEGSFFVGVGLPQRASKASEAFQHGNRPEQNRCRADHEYKICWICLLLSFCFLRSKSAKLRQG